MRKYVKFKLVIQLQGNFATNGIFSMQFISFQEPKSDILDKVLLKLLKRQEDSAPLDASYLLKPKRPNSSNETNGSPEVVEKCRKKESVSGNKDEGEKDGHAGGSIDAVKAGVVDKTPAPLPRLAESKETVAENSARDVPSKSSEPVGEKGTVLTNAAVGTNSSNKEAGTNGIIASDAPEKVETLAVATLSSEEAKSSGAGKQIESPKQDSTELISSSSSQSASGAKALSKEEKRDFSKSS